MPKKEDDWVKNIPETVRECLRAVKQIASESTTIEDETQKAAYCSPDRVKMLGQLTITIEKLTYCETKRIDLISNRWAKEEDQDLLPRI